ncbi:hypothetical protein [Streptomyces sp. Z26]|uniref:hypothetical protein n=1 Tax=Streptomyces sp. Z26 TaxID=2500177 RepID=UPI000EF16B2C|nr:hypothetical protein [Streptomyces sp. Z26]RLL70119.1 hypothetical protein D7M15_03205 [Streptomyces sp. Z26]
MMTNGKIGVALVGGYVLGRTKKAKLAIALGMALAGKKLSVDPQQLVRMAANSPAFSALSKQVREELLDSTRTAATSALTSRANRLADSLQNRSAGLEDDDRDGDDARDGDAEASSDERDTDRDRDGDSGGERKGSARETDSGSGSGSGSGGGERRTKAASAQPRKAASGARKKAASGGGAAKSGARTAGSGARTAKSGAAKTASSGNRGGRK